MWLLIIWNIFLTTSFIFLILVIGKLIEQIEAIKSWYPFCELLKIKIDKEEVNECNYKNRR